MLTLVRCRRCQPERLMDCTGIFFLFSPHFWEIWSLLVSKPTMEVRNRRSEGCLKARANNHIAQSISLLIGAVIPAYANMHNTLPARLVLACTVNPSLHH